MQKLRGCGGCTSPPNSYWTRSLLTNSDIRFTNILLLDGYLPYTMNEVMRAEGDRFNANCWDDILGRSFEFTAILEADQANSGQQQQQQQQTIILPNQQSQLGTIHVTTNVQDAEILVDGAFVGNAPATLRLGAGMHVVEISKEGYETFRREIRLLGDSEVTLRAELTTPN